MNRIKILLVAILTTVLLTISVSGTLAWLQDNTGEVENVFTPSKVDTEIEENFDNNIKSSIVITNKADSIPVYVRVAVVGNWIKDNQIVEAWTPSFEVGAGWLKGTDGYYYHTAPVAANSSTGNLLGSTIEATPRADGSYLEVNVIHQSIQANPETVVEGAWKVEVEDGNIIGLAAAN